MLQLLHLEHDHGFVDGLEQGVGQARAAVEEATLEHVEQQELDQGPGGKAAEEFLLVEAAAVEVALKERNRLDHKIILAKSANEFTTLTQLR